MGGVGVLGFWGFGVLGFLGFWGFGVFGDYGVFVFGDGGVLGVISSSWNIGTQWTTELHRWVSVPSSDDSWSLGTSRDIKPCGGMALELSQAFSSPVAGWRNKRIDKKYGSGYLACVRVCLCGKSSGDGSTT